MFGVIFKVEEKDVEVKVKIEEVEEMKEIMELELGDIKDEVGKVDSVVIEELKQKDLKLGEMD